MANNENDFAKIKKADVVKMLIECRQEVEISKQRAHDLSRSLKEKDADYVKLAKSVEGISTQINYIKVIAEGFVAVNYPDFAETQHNHDQYGNLTAILNTDTEPPIGAKALNHIIAMCG